jgi:hypothetical protein
MENRMKIARRIGSRISAFGVSTVGGHRTSAGAAWCRHLPVLVLGICLSAAVPAVCHAQSSGGGDLSEEKMESYAKIMRAQAVLIELPLMFQQDAELEAMRAAYEGALEAAMVDLDPQTTQRVSRLSVLQDQAMAGSGDQASLLEEGRKLRDALLATAARARRQPSVAVVEEPFTSALKERVKGLDGVDAATKELVTTGDLLIDVVTTMSVLSQ